MKNMILSAVIVAAGILAVVNAASAADIREGKWSMTTVMRVEGMDGQAAEAMNAMEGMSPEDKAMMQQMMGGMNIGGPGGGMGMTSNSTQCITNDNPVPQASGQDCQTTHTVNGNTVHFETTCADSHSTGDVTYENDSMTGTIKSTLTERGQTQDVTIDINGEYVGPCE